MEMYRKGIKPSIPLGGHLQCPGTQRNLSTAFEAFDKALHPVMADRVNEIVPHRGYPQDPTRLSPEDRQKIEAALPVSGLAVSRRNPESCW